MSNQKLNIDNAGVKLPPPLLYLGLGLIGVGIHVFFPWPLGVPALMRYLGVALILIITILGRQITKKFEQEGTNVAPWETTNKLIFAGPYRYSRNPIYVLGCGLLLGLGILFNTYWAVLAIIPALTIVYYTAIKKEEEYLERKFGEKYLAYKARVKRWL